jgi:hypothetical protein
VIITGGASASNSAGQSSGCDSRHAQACPGNALQASGAGDVGFAQLQIRTHAEMSVLITRMLMRWLARLLLSAEVPTSVATERLTSFSKTLPVVGRRRKQVLSVVDWAEIQYCTDRSRCRSRKSRTLGFRGTR